MRMEWRMAIITAALIGGVLPFRPFLHAADPATDTIDLFISPAYIVGRFLPPMGDLGSGIFFAAAVLINIVLYALVANYLYGKLAPRPN
jgi:hypothetical protein